MWCFTMCGLFYSPLRPRLYPCMYDRRSIIIHCLKTFRLDCSRVRLVDWNVFVVVVVIIKVIFVVVVFVFQIFLVLVVVLIFVVVVVVLVVFLLLLLVGDGGILLLLLFLLLRLPLLTFVCGSTKRWKGKLF